MKLIPIFNTIPATTQWDSISPDWFDTYSFVYNGITVSVTKTAGTHQEDVNTGLAAVNLSAGVVTADYTGTTLTLTCSSVTDTIYGGDYDDISAPYTEDPTAAYDTPAKQIEPTSTNVGAGGNPDYMFDGFLNHQTENADLIEVEIDFDNKDRVAIFNVDAYSIDLELTDDDTSTVVQTETIDLEMSDGYYQEWVVENLYIYANATLKISINKSGGTAKCGQVAIGLSTDIGTTLYAPRIGFIDYSIKDTDTFGRTYLNQGGWAKKPSITTRMNRAVMDAVFEDLVAVRGKVSVFECNENDASFESLRVYGFIEDWTIRMNEDYTGAYLDIDLQGVI